MKVYAYCLTTLEPNTPADLTGLFAQPVYTLSKNRITALISAVPEASVAVSKHNVLTHQRVVAAVLEWTTPLPFRFGTVVTEAQLTSYVEARQEALLQKLAAVEGCVEMSVKVIWEKVKRDSHAGGELEPSAGPGTTFLRAKSKALIGSQDLAGAADDLAKWLKNQLESFVRDTRIAVRPAHRLVIAADYLVERTGLESFRLAVEKVTMERPDLHFLASGPWPPYSFANIDLEFKSQFGVS